MLKEQLQLTKSQLEAAHVCTQSSSLSEIWNAEKTKKEEFCYLIGGKKKRETSWLNGKSQRNVYGRSLKDSTSKNSLEYQLLEIKKPNMQIKPNTGMLKDAHEFKEEHPQHPHDFQNVMQLFDSQEQVDSSRSALPQEHKKEKSCPVT